MKRAWLVVLITVFADPVMAAELPSQVLDLTGWKLTLPYNTDHPGNPDQRVAEDLLQFQHPRSFHVSKSGRGVVFRASCDGLTTKNSDYPRCELREMKVGGKTKANWSTSDKQRHTLIASLAITETPAVKKHVVCAQIHEMEDDLMMVRLEGKKLFVERNDLADVRLDSNYKLGTRFSLKIEATGGHARVWYNGQLKMDWAVSSSQCYFKAGCYTQSNTKKGDLPTAAGEVVIYQLQVTHGDH